MRWYLLKDRRHEGPFSKEQVVEGLRAGRIDPKDYLLPEQAVTDQSSFAYLAAADVAGPEAMFDLEKNQPKGFQHNTNSVGVSEKSVTDFTGQGKAKLESLKSEFDEGIESTQLLSVRAQTLAPSGAPAVIASAANSSQAFVSEPSSSDLPWKWIGVMGCAVLVLFAALYKLDFIGDSKAPVLASGESAVGKQELHPNRVSPARPNIPANQNRIPTSNFDLPVTGRTSLPSENLILAPDRPSDESEHPARRKFHRKNKSDVRDGATADQDEAAAADSENVDDSDRVDEDKPTEDQTDEPDLR